MGVPRVLVLFYLLLTYLVAAVPWGVLVATLTADVDIMSEGSGNIGATNVHRVLGRTAGALTLAGDVGKGFVPVLLSQVVIDDPFYGGLVALVAFAGHCWSPYLDFRGGKGVATAAGGMLALAPLPLVVVASAWVAVVLWTRKSSLGALVSVLLLPLVVGLLVPEALWTAVILAGGVVWRHKPNIQRLRKRTGA